VNLGTDPAKHTNYKIANRELPQIIARLDALMLVLKSCEGDACRYPWRQLHPAGEVNSLADALDYGFDIFYTDQPKVSFSSCEDGYMISAEGPQNFSIYGG
jgi:N-acetylglucosamine-6-sulfatase